MTKRYQVSLPDNIVKEVEKIANSRGQGYATVIKGIVCEQINKKVKI